MEFGQLEQILDEALQQVLAIDGYLLKHDLNERTISHRLAVYLENQFNEFTVDCEYNGNIDADNDRKFLKILRMKALQLRLIDEDGNEQENVDCKVYPDIIIHKRGQNGSENNLLIIEVKKSSNRDNGEWDAEKLSRFTSREYENNYNYLYGAFVRFTVGEKPSFTVQWYQNGDRFI